MAKRASTPYSQSKGEWREVPGYPKYQANIHGEIRVLRKNGFCIVGTATGRDGGVRILKDNCDLRRARMVYTAFCGKIPEGMQIIHRNGVVNDDRVCNLALRKHPRAKVVVKCDTETLMTVKRFRTISEAAKDAGCTVPAMRYRLDGKAKCSFGEYEYFYDNDQKSHKAMMERIRRGKWEGYVRNRKS